MNTLSFDAATFKISFLVGDIMTNALPTQAPLPYLTISESEQLRAQLLTEISWLREFGEREGSKKEQKFIDRVIESLNNDDARLGLVDRGKGGEETKKGLERGTQFSFTDVSGITMVLRLKNLTDEMLLDIYEGIKQQIVDRGLELPDLELRSTPPTPVLRPMTAQGERFNLTESASACSLGPPYDSEESDDLGALDSDGCNSAEIFYELEDTASVDAVNSKSPIASTKRIRDISRAEPQPASIFKILAFGMFLGLAFGNWRQIQDNLFDSADLAWMNWGAGISASIKMIEESLKQLVGWLLGTWEGLDEKL